MAFHGLYAENILNVHYKKDHPVAARAAHGDAMHALIQDTLAARQPHFLHWHYLCQPAHPMPYIHLYLQRKCFVSSVHSLSITQPRMTQIITISALVSSL